LLALQTLVAAVVVALIPQWELTVVTADLELLL
jgi:hypothetical protein